MTKIEQAKKALEEMGLIQKAEAQPQWLVAPKDITDKVLGVVYNAEANTPIPVQTIVEKVWECKLVSLPRAIADDMAGKARNQFSHVQKRGSKHGLLVYAIRERRDSKQFGKGKGRLVITGYFRFNKKTAAPADWEIVNSEMALLNSRGVQHQVMSHLLYSA